MRLSFCMLFAVCLISFHLKSIAQSLHLVPHAIHLQNGKEFTLNIPQGYDISVAAQDLHRLRFMAKSPDGRMFVTDMYDLSDNKNGKVYLLEGWDKTACRYTKIITFASGLHNPNQVAFYSSGGKQYIYISETDKLTRYEYHPGDTALKGKAELIATFPDYGLSYKYGGWHLTRSLAFNNGKLYVSVGSSCNA